MKHDYWPANRIVVGFGDHESSLGALRWSVRLARETGLPLSVVHATDIGIAVRNGPSSVVAHRLGSPLWASLYTLVQGLDAPSSTETVVATGFADRVLIKHVNAHDLVVLGKRSRMPGSADLERRLVAAHGCKVIRISGDYSTLPENASDDHVVRQTDTALLATSGR